MNVTAKDRPVRQQAEQTKAAIRPALFQMRHYPTHGIMEELTFMLIRPPRFLYNPDILRPPRKIAHRFTAETFQIPFQLTLYRQQNMRYVILYLHGNGSSRFQGTLFLSSLPSGVGLACFDFSGCGNRAEREFITLGQEEKKDVDVAARFLKSKGYRVVGWGRSMGAVSLLMSSECDIMVSDSAYSNLSQLCNESSSHFIPKACCCIFHCFFPCVFACIKCKVHSLAGLTIDQMDVAGQLREVQDHRRICFIHGQEDTLIPYYHAERLYESFKGVKMLVLFEGTHNSSRPQEVLAKCFEFIEDALKEGNKDVRNTKILEMNELKKVIHQPLPPIREQSKLDKPSSLLPTHESSEINAIRKDTSQFNTVHSNASHRRITQSPVKEEYEEFGGKETLPVNFRDAFGNEELDKCGEKEENEERRIRMDEMIFSKKRNERE